jgi:3-oxoadipate enol-lactonase
VIRYDARGHGASDAPAGDYSVEMMAKDALAAMDALGVQKANFVGLSMGGMIGMWLAAHEPERIDKLVLANTTARIPATDMLNGWIAKAKAEGLAGLAEPIITGWLSQGFRDANPARTRALVDAMGGMTIDGFCGSVAVLRDSDRREDLAKITAPTLVIAGVEDGPRGDAAAQALADGIAGAKRANLPAAAHLSPVENPSAFAEAVGGFLAG